MILGDDIQVQLFRQSAFGAAPGTPNGILLPRGSNFSVDFDQKLIDNPQVFMDAIEREPGLGNKTSGCNGDLVPNLNFLPVLQEALGGNLTVTGSSAPYTCTTTSIGRTIPYYMVELGIIPWSKYYRFYDMMLSEFHLEAKVEGICTINTKFAGTGNVLFPPANTSLDTTPTELVGPSLNYCDMVLLENADSSAGDIESMKLDITRKVVEKRPSGAAGVATQLRAGRSQVRLTVKCFFESDARWARARNGTISQISMTLVDRASNQSVLSTAEVKLQPVGPKFTGDDDAIYQEFSVTAFRGNNTTTTPLTIVTTNQLGVTA